MDMDIDEIQEEHMDIDEIQEEQSQNINGEDDRTKVLCIQFKNGKLGAAYFDFKEKILYMYEEVSDCGPNFLVTCALYREVAPKYLLLFNSSCDEFIKAVLQSRSTMENDTTYSSNSGKLPPNVFLVSAKDFSYEVSKSKVSKIIVSSLTKIGESKPEQELYIHSLINLKNRLSVQTLGALHQYLEKNWQFLKGAFSSTREGISIFKMFLSDCKSKLGHVSLRNMLMTPINDKEELEKRLNFISFVMKSENSDYVKCIQTSIGRITDINFKLSKIKNARATNSDWNSLHNTMKQIICINQVSKRHVAKSKLLKELNEALTENLLGLQESIENCLDFTAGQKRGRPVIKFGLDEMLDAKLLRRRDISKHVTAAASFAINDLPDYINECKVVYLPEMGHVMEIKEWEPNCDTEQLRYLGFQFMFALGGAIFYKNPLCVELDKQLGDINSEIIDHENRIIRRLSTYILKYSQDIRNPLKIIAQIDALISMAKTAQTNRFVRPTLNNDNVHEIEKCRHPLLEQLLSNFQANDFFSGKTYSHMKIITGPNGSGKSVYLKQVALNIFLAHVGSFVPAKSANIGLTKSIHCRIHQTESAAVKLSSFMIDVAQTSQALYYATSNSVVLIDEFGRGTLANDGLVLLVSVLKTFLQRDEFCPHVIVSTHFQRVASYIPESNLVEYFKTDHIRNADGQICFLYSFSKGMSSSFAFDIAARILNPDIVKRARELFECFKDENDLENDTDESIRNDGENICSLHSFSKGTSSSSQ